MILSFFFNFCHAYLACFVVRNIFILLRITVFQTAIVKNNPHKFLRSLGDGERVEFDVVIGDKGNEAVRITGINGTNVLGSRYAPDKTRYKRPVITKNQPRPFWKRGARNSVMAHYLSSSPSTHHEVKGY